MYQKPTGNIIISSESLKASVKSGKKSGISQFVTFLQHGIGNSVQINSANWRKISEHKINLQKLHFYVLIMDNMKMKLRI